MQRTQIALTDEERQALDAAVTRTGRSLSALIRDAVEKVYGSGRSTEGDLATMRQTFGSWRGPDRDGATWVERRRPGIRLSQHQA
ncbi:MAG: ribbon-helix-helix protein, CopG family [Chloroflexota bacterium]